MLHIITVGSITRHFLWLILVRKARIQTVVKMMHLPKESVIQADFLTHDFAWKILCCKYCCVRVTLLCLCYSAVLLIQYFVCVTVLYLCYSFVYSVLQRYIIFQCPRAVLAGGLTDTNFNQFSHFRSILVLTLY